jgi:hypothetical protein
MNSAEMRYLLRGGRSSLACLREGGLQPRRRVCFGLGDAHAQAISLVMCGDAFRFEASQLVLQAVQRREHRFGRRGAASARRLRLRVPRRPRHQASKPLAAVAPAVAPSARAGHQGSR